MSLNISINTNTIAIQENINHISINEPKNPNIINIIQPITEIIEIITRGPIGPIGASGSVGPAIDISLLVTTSSFNTFTSSYNTGSFTGSFSGSLFGTSSYTTQALSTSFSNNSISASYAVSSSYADNSNSSSYSVISSNSISSSYSNISLSSSYATTSSFIQNAQSASYILNAISSSFSSTASFALKAETLINTSSFITTSSFNTFTSSYNTGSFTGSFSGSLSGNATTASYLSTPTLINGSIIFSDGNTIAQDNSNFFWDNINKILIVGAGNIQESSIIQINSTTQGFLPPRMTTQQKDAIISPTIGLIVYDITLLSLHQYNGNIWIAIGEVLIIKTDFEIITLAEKPNASYIYSNGLLTQINYANTTEYNSNVKNLNYTNGILLSLIHSFVYDLQNWQVTYLYNYTLGNLVSKTTTITKN